jgi:hypothetical protein
MTTVNLPSWRAFKGEIGEPLFGAQRSMGQLMFRGQALADWPLQSSFDRAWIKAKKPPEEIGTAYQGYLKFFRLLNARQGRDLSALSDAELSGIAQHYGMPTRLLDWSLSPYMAAFFAFYYRYMNFARDPDRYVAIWAVDVAKMRERLTPQFEVLTADASKNARLSSQIGKFTYAAADDHDLTAAMIAAEPVEGPLFWKVTIPASEAKTALNDLMLMGISPSDVYPDFQGVADYVRLRMRFEGLEA